MPQINEIKPESATEFTQFRRYKVVVVSSSGARCFMPYAESDDVDLVGIIDMSLPREIPKSKSEKIIEFIKRNRPLGCKLRMTRLARRRNCSFYQYRGNQVDELEQRLRELEPDIVVVYRLPLLKPEVLSIPKIGFLNIHPSLLPKYRGGNPILWMSKNYDLNGGVTVHFMDEKADTGPILGQESFAIESGMSADEIEHRAIYEVGIPLSLQVVRELAQGKCSPIAQQETSPTEYAYRKKPDQIWQMIDWETWSLEHTWHMLRYNPFWKIKLPDSKGWRSWVEWRVGKFIKEFNDTAPGQVLNVGGGYAISHKEGWIKINPVIHPPHIIKRLFKVLLH